MWYANESGSGVLGNASYAEGKRICAGCVVRDECLAWALLTAEPFGLWGCKTPRERSDMLRDLGRRPLRARSVGAATSLRGKR